MKLNNEHVTPRRGGAFASVEENQIEKTECGRHRRRVDLEDKAKVVAYAWGAESLPR